MTSTRPSPEDIRKLRELATAWGKVIARRAFGPQGPGQEVSLSVMEELALEVSRGLVEGTLHTLLEQQAQTLATEHPCPDCQRPCPVQRDPRTLPFKGGHHLQHDEPFCHCPDCRRDFSPLRPALGLDGHGYSPLCQIVTLAATLNSFAQAAKALAVTDSLDISPRHVSRLAREVGLEMAHTRDDNARQHRQRQLPAEVANAPTLAAVEVDGGRLFTRQAGCGPGVHQAQAKEDKIGCLLNLESCTHAEDPQPEPPPIFRDCRRVVRLVQRVHGGPPGLMPEKDEPAAKKAQPAAAADDEIAVEPWRGAPRRRLRTCVATLPNSQAFGPMVAAEAQRRNFYAAPQQVFLGDGAAYNWSIQRGYFPHAIAIADFLHVVCYVYLAAWAVTTGSATQGGAAPRNAQEHGELYTQWMRGCWRGEVAGVIAELALWQEKLGRPPPGEPLDDNDPVKLLAEGLTYLQNNQERMDYPRYRKQGLPVTSSLVESLVGEFNARVKEKNKHWERPVGGEAILQLRAAVLSEDDRLARFFANRPGCLYRRRPSIN